ncbi:hypothetical protein [Occallatibacter riparius]|uniref:Uncharacterized protein n=1 Tax=Occallatibacter riparius TaxID=1002689 RepID=A0A9J7BUW7_9BACT|nr:hypothetical protein [Occallatibacter riparius]UWZ86416.1 hypothetical protein MOP44_10835 [Occallatibacter riparius]
MYSAQAVAQTLRDIIKTLEQNTDLHPEDPSVLELKRILHTRISALEIENIQAQPPTPSAYPAGGPLDSN